MQKAETDRVRANEVRVSDSRERLRLDMFSSIVASGLKGTQREISWEQSVLWLHFEGVDTGSKMAARAWQVLLTNQDEDERSEGGFCDTTVLKRRGLLWRLRLNYGG